MHDVIKKIKLAIAEANKTQSIAQLIDLNLKLAGYLAYLVEVQTAAHKGYNDAYALRKQEYANRVINGDGSMGDRQMRAELEIREFRDTENRFDERYTELKNYSFATSGFIDVLTQKIAYLRKEQEITRQNT